MIGCLWLDHGYRLKRLGVIGDPDGGTGTPDERERGLLEDFSRFVGRARPVLVTYNGRSFDLPVIALRSLCHAVSLGWYYRERASATATASRATSICATGSPITARPDRAASTRSRA